MGCMICNTDRVVPVQLINKSTQENSQSQQQTTFQQSQLIQNSNQNENNKQQLNTTPRQEGKSLIENLSEEQSQISSMRNQNTINQLPDQSGQNVDYNILQEQNSQPVQSFCEMQQEISIQQKNEFLLRRTKKFKKKELKSDQIHYFNQLGEDCQDFFEKSSSHQLTYNQLNEAIKNYDLDITFILHLKNDLGFTLLEWILFNDQFELFLQSFEQIQLTKNANLFQLQLKFFSKMKQVTKKKVDKQIEFITFIKRLKEIENTNLLLNYFHEEQDKFGIIRSYDEPHQLFNLLSYINFNNQMHLKLFRNFLKLMQHSSLQFTKEFQALYIKQKLNQNFKLCKLSKKIPLGQSNLNDQNDEILSKSRIRYHHVYDLLLLKDLNYNIFHQIAQEKRWTIFLQYNNELYQQTSNVDGTTPVMLMFKYAPLKVIEDYLNQNTKDLVTFNKRNLNILHLLCLNQNLFDQEQQNHLSSLCEKLKEFLNLEQLANQPFEQQLPIHFYLNSKFEKSMEFIKFLVSYLKIPELNLSLLRFQADILAQLCQVVEMSLVKRQGFALQKAKPRKLKRNNKVDLSDFRQNDYVQALIKQFDQAYLYHTQFAKILFKQRNFNDATFNWVNWSWCASYVPFDFSSLDTGFITLFIEEQLEKSYELIEELQPIEEEDKQLVELVNQIISKQKENESKTDTNQNLESYKIQLINYNPKAQYIKQLLVFMKALQRHPQEKVMKLVQMRIVDLLKPDQTLLLHPLVGKFVFSQLKIETIYTILYQLQNRELLEQCLILPASIPKDPFSQCQFLYNIQALKLNQIIQDPIEQALFNYIPVSAILRFVYKNSSLKVELSIQKEVAPQSNLFKINLYLNNRFLFKFLTTSKYQSEYWFEEDHLIQYIWNSKLSFEQEVLEQDYVKDTEVRISLNQQLDCKRIFEWSKKQIKFNFKYLHYHPNLNDQDVHSKLVLEMVKYKKSFFQSLLLHDEFNKDIEELIQKDERNIEIIFNPSVIVEMINAKVQKNLSLIIDILDQQFSEENKHKFPNILQALSKKYFQQNQKFYWKPEQKTIEEFNSNLSFLLSILDKKSAHVPEVCWIFKQRDLLYYIYPYLTKATFDQIGQKRLTNLIWNTNEYKDCICSQLKDEFLIKFYLDVKLEQAQIQTNAEIGNLQREEYIEHYHYNTFIGFLQRKLKKYPQIYQETIKSFSKDIYDWRESKILKNILNQTNPIKGPFTFKYYLKQFIEDKKGLTGNTQFYDSFIRLINPQMLKNQFILKYVYNNLIENQSISVKKMQQKWTRWLFLIDPEYIESKIELIELSTTLHSQLYNLALYYKRIKMLNFLLFKTEQSQFKISLQLTKQTKENSEFNNYRKATKISYPVALSLQQYKNFYEQVQSNNKDQILKLQHDHCKIFLANGLYEKLEFLLQLYKNPNQLFGEVIQLLFKLIKQEKFDLNQDLLNYEKLYLPDNAEQQKIYHFFSQEESTKKIIPNVPISEQNSNLSYLMKITEGQKQDFVRTARLIHNYLQSDKLSKDQQSIYQLCYNLLFPQNKIIQLKQVWKDVIIQQFNPTKLKCRCKCRSKYQYKCRCEMKPKYKCTWIIENQQDYIATYRINNCVNETLKIEKIYLHSKLPLLKEFLLSSNEDKNQISNIIIQSSERHSKLLNYVTQNFKFLTNLKLNDNTYYYFKQKIPIIKQKTYNLSTDPILQLKYNKIKKYMDVSKLDLEKCTAAQFCLLQGRSDHLLEYKFQISDLAAAVISNNFRSVQFVMSHAQHGYSLVLNYNVFQSLVIQMNEENVIECFNKYIKPQSLDANRLMFRDNTPILYYVIHKRMFRLFELFYMKYLTYLYGKEKQAKLVLDQLNYQPNELIEKENKLSIYQYAILTKFYQVLDIVQMYEEDLQYVQRSLFLFDNVQEIQLFPKYNLLIRLYRSLSQFNISLNKKEVQCIKQGRYYIEKILYIRDQRIDEILQLEKTCLAIVHGYECKTKFTREILNLLILHDINQLEEYRCQPQLVSLFLALHGERIEEIENDKNLNEAVQLIRQIKKIKPIPGIYEKICKMCNDCKWPNHPIYRMIIQRNPKLFMEPDFKEIVFKNLELAVDFVTSQIDKDQLREYLEDLKKQYFVTKEQPQIIKNIIFIMILIHSILINEFDQQFIIKNMVNHIQIQKTLNQLNKINLQNTSNSLDNFNLILFQLYPNLKFEDNECFKKIPLQFKNNLIQAFTSLNIMLNIKLQTEIFLNQKQMKNQDWTIIENPSFLINFNDQPRQNENLENSYALTFQFSKDLSIYVLMEPNEQQENGLLKKIIHQAYDLIVNMNLKFVIDDFLNINLTEFSDDSINLSEDKLLEKFLFLVELMKEQQKVGVYTVQDLHAPHIYEQVRRSETQTHNLWQSSTLQSGILQSRNFNHTSLQTQIRQREQFQFMFELLPNNTYQVRQQNKQGSKELIFVEFYHFIQPSIKVNLIQLNEKEYNKQYGASNTISLMIQDFNKYKEYLEEILTNKQSKEWVINFPFYIKRDQFAYKNQLFSSYNIQNLMIRTLQFIEDIRSQQQKSQLQWRISIMSLLEVIISKLVQFRSDKNEQINIQEIIDQVFKWDTLRMILRTVIYENLYKAQEVLKVIKGIYVEFNEVQQIDFVGQTNLDNIFGFSFTQYQLYYHMLIIRINIGLREQSKLEQQKFANLNFRQYEAKHFWHITDNEFDFYHQIFQPDQIIQILFNQIDINRKLLRASQEISRITNRTITISFDHDQLNKIYVSKIRYMKCLPPFEKCMAMEQVSSTISTLKNYLNDNLLNYIKQQIESDQCVGLFYYKLLKLIESFSQDIPYQKVLNKNSIDLTANKKKVLKLIGQFDQDSPKIQQHFGFQIPKNYYFNISENGDICMINYQKDNAYNLILCQLGDNSFQSKLEFVIIKNQEQFLTQDEIEDKQYKTNPNCLTTSINIEDIHSVIIFKNLWPSDLIFNQNIINLFFTGIDHSIYICKEPKFIEKISFIHSDRQDKIDYILGKYILQANQQFRLSQLFQIIPDQISIVLQNSNQFRQQKSTQTRYQNLQILLKQDKLQISKIQFYPINISHYLHSIIPYQVKVSEFSNYLKKNKVIKSVELIFDDNMNSDPEQYLGGLQQNLQIFDIFREAFDQFFFDRIGGPKLNQSLQYFFGFQDLKQIKEHYFNQLIKSVQFHFITYIEDDLIQLKDGILKLFLCNNGTIPEEYQIYQFLTQLILNYKNNILNDLISHQNIQYKITNRYDNDQQKQIIDLIFLMKYLATLMLTKSQTVSINISSMFELQSSFSQMKNNFYFFNQNEAFILYNNSQDFSLKEFLLNYLNGSQDKRIIYQPNTYIGQPIQESSFWEKANLKEQFNKVLPEEDIELIQLSQYALLLRKNQDSQYIDCAVVPHLEKDKKLIEFSKQQDHDGKIQIEKGKELRLLINESKRESVNTVMVNNGQIQLSLSEFILQNKNNKISISQQYISERDVLFEFQSRDCINLKLNSQNSNIQVQPCSQRNNLEINYIEKTVCNFSLTQHPKIEVQMDNQTKTIQNQHFKENNHSQQIEQNNKKLIDVLKKSLSTLTQGLQGLFVQEKIPVQIDKEILKVNKIKSLSQNQQQLSTRCGWVRKDYLQFVDYLGNITTNFKFESLIFVHNTYPSIQYIPKYIIEQQQMILEWKPIIKGIYLLYVDQFEVKGNFVVLANEPCIETSSLETPNNLKVVRYFEKLTFRYHLKDIYSNIYGEFEQDKYNEANCKAIISVVKDQEQQNDLQNQRIQNITNIKIKKINQSGQLNCSIKFIPYQDDLIPLNLKISIYFNNQLMNSTEIQLEGISLEKRKEIFRQELMERIQLREESLSVRRIHFLQDLLKIADMDMKTEFSIDFENERGLDFSGLSREFYDMIGSTFKDETYQFFSPAPTNLSKYFFHDHFNTLQDKTTYALLFGKLVANAIANNYLIGIDFVPPFWKVIFGDELKFEDLTYILDEQTYKNYELLRTIDQVDSICQYFTFGDIDIIENGANILVIKENLEQFLQKTAEYLIFDKFKDIYQSFIDGFNSVFDLVILKTWIQPSEMTVLTQGYSEIQGEFILSKTIFIDGNAQLKAFWETYVMEAEPELLVKMLQFITGSSSIPFQFDSYQIKVNFTKSLNVDNHPEAHTCFKKIDVPYYSSFFQLKQKLDYAFNHGLGNFGFA